MLNKLDILFPMLRILIQHECLHRPKDDHLRMISSSLKEEHRLA